MTRVSHNEVQNAFARIIYNLQQSGIDTTGIALDHNREYGGYTLTAKNGAVNITGSMMNADRCSASKFIDRADFFCKMIRFVQEQKDIHCVRTVDMEIVYKGTQESCKEFMRDNTNRYSMLGLYQY
jgi:hypothetical protein